jgi:aerobic carbon-monoxide dehydrogenase small subunit
VAVSDLIDSHLDGDETPVLRFVLNGVERTESVPARMSLWELLHDRLALRGTKLACSRGVCGSCSVLIDGLPQASCSTFAFSIDGRRVDTIEGIAAAAHPLCDAFAARSAFQCGYCTSGMVVIAKALLDRDPHPTRQTIIEWLSSNVCRCTGYEMIIEAVLAAAEASSDG